MYCAGCGGAPDEILATVGISLSDLISVYIHAVAKSNIQGRFFLVPLPSPPHSRTQNCEPNDILRESRNNYAERWIPKFPKRGYDEYIFYYV